MLKIEEYLLNKKIVVADDIYISDGVVAVDKRHLKNNILKNYKYIPDEPKSLYKNIKEKGLLYSVEYNMGEEFELPDYCILAYDETIRIPYDKDDKYSFNYELVKMFFNDFNESWRDIITYISDCADGKVLKFFSSYFNGEEYEHDFIGLIMAIKDNK